MTRVTTKLNCNIKHKHIAFSYMFLQSIKFAKTSAIMSTKYSTTFSVTCPKPSKIKDDKVVSDFTKDPKSNHPNVRRSSYDSADCDKRNCADDNSSCVNQTLKIGIVAHLTQSIKSVEKDKQIVELLNHTGSRGGRVSAVFYDETVEVPKQNLYDGIMYSDTKAIQKDEQTAVLNKHTHNKSKNSENNNEQNNKHE